MNKIILSIAFLFSLSLSYADTPILEFPKGQEGPVQFFETPTRYMRFIKYIEKQLSFQ